MATAAQFVNTAPFLAKKKLSEFETNNTAQATGDTGDFGDSFPGYQWQILTAEVNSEMLGEATGLRQIDVVVSMNSGKNIFQLRTYRFVIE